MVERFPEDRAAVTLTVAVLRTSAGRQSAVGAAVPSSSGSGPRYTQQPVGAIGGKRAIMECIAPLGPVYQAGTLSGNPVAVAAGLATLAATDARRNSAQAS